MNSNCMKTVDDGNSSDSSEEEVEITDVQLHPLHHLSSRCIIINLERFADKSDRITTERQMANRAGRLWALEELRLRGSKAKLKF